MKIIFALFLLSASAFAQSSPMLSMATEAYAKACPTQLKITSVDLQKKNAAEYKKEFGAKMYADLLKGSHDKMMEKGGCNALVSDLKAKGAQASNALNVTLK
jgi:hypothetical protein